MLSLRKILGRMLSPPSRKCRRPARLELLALEDRSTPAVLTINSAADNIVADNSLTLREAVRLVDYVGNANAALGRALTAAEKSQITGIFGSGDRVQLSTSLNYQTITLKGGELAISRALILDATATTQVTISANKMSRVFNIDNGTSTTISVSILGSANGFSLINGSTTGKGGIITNAENLTIYQTEIRGGVAQFGGGVYNSGTLNIAGFTWFKSNSARPGSGGGAIYNAGALTGSNAFFSFNTATYGGAIENYGPATATLSFANFDANSADGVDGGGAIFNSGKLNLDSPTFTFNTALSGSGGAIRSAGGTTTISGTYYFKNNTAVNGGAIANDFRATVSAYGSTGGTGYFVQNTSTNSNFGGAIDNRGILAMDGNTLFTKNRGNFGGAIYNGANANASLNHVVFDGNFAYFSGGALYNAGTMLVNNGRIVNNQANVDGGGIANFGKLTVLATYMTANRADSDGAGFGSDNSHGGTGGAIFTASPTPVRLHNVNITGNFRGLGQTSDDEASEPPGSFIVD